MPKLLAFRNFVKDLGMRISAAAVVIGIFFGLGYVKRTDFLGLSGFIDSNLAFFSTGFLIVTVVAAAWILYQRSSL